MSSRRNFLKRGVAGGAGLWLTSKLGWMRSVYAQIPGGTLDPGDVPQYVTPLLIPPVMPKAGTINLVSGKTADYYEISMRQISQQILPAGMPKTTVWGYGAVKSASKKGLLLHNAPSLTFEAIWNRPVRVKWINELVDGNGNYLPHLLPVDPTLHWTNPPGATNGRDMRPEFPSTPGRYTGPVPIVTHLHGAVGVGDESDGYAEAWCLPAAGNIPAGYATEGTWYNFFKSNAQARFGASWGAGFAIFQYPNKNRASTLWYHDHALGMTRLNVYAGPAGFYIVRGGSADTVMDSRTGMPAVLPGPAPAVGDPAGLAYHEIPIAIQDRSFNADGSLFYPDNRAFFDGIMGPYIPDTDISPIWNPEFFGNMMMVNGNTWPYLRVDKRRYRFRFLNGCNSRFLILDFNNIPGVEVWQIGNEGGFLATPANLTADNGNWLLMGPAERADVIGDFTNVPRGRYVLGNVGPDEPFGGGDPGFDFEPADSGTTGQVMEFRVGSTGAPDPTTPPEFLQLPAIAAFPPASVTRRLALLEELSDDFVDAPAEAHLGTVNGNPVAGHGVLVQKMWADRVTENPQLGATEVWEFYNATADAHPIHIHEIVFEVVNRQPIFVDEENQTVEVTGSTRTAEPWETGFKDTVIAYPGELTRVKARFDTAGQFVWHCHIVEHEDNEMMRPYRIGPLQAGQPE
jgi:FtsP/CotA-like multicopper oxidase with cupredoxin domain